MGVVLVFRAKANIYAIIIGEENVARKLLEGNPWFIKNYSFSVKFWPFYHSLHDIEADRVIYWIQAHGIPKNYYTVKNARNLGSKIGSILEFEDSSKSVPQLSEHKSSFRWPKTSDHQFLGSLSLARVLSNPASIRGSQKLLLPLQSLGSLHDYLCSAALLPTRENRYLASLCAEPSLKANVFLFPTRPSRLSSGANEPYWRQKWNCNEGCFYGLPDVERDILANNFLKIQNDKELS